MNSLFQLTVKNIVTEKLVIKANMLPWRIFLNFQQYKKILDFHKLYSKLPALPDECFVFDKDLSIDLQQTFERAEKVMDPIGVFAHYIEHRNLEWMKSAWSRLDEEQQTRIRSSEDELMQALAEYLETGVPPPNYRLFALYKEAKTKNANMRIIFWKMCSTELQQVILFVEFYETRQ
uniref:PX domain-containing protein n=1 Tax=Steinernema glaseri TaxID=37863 RepID=A0A1I8ANJ7_9BILA